MLVRPGHRSQASTGPTPSVEVPGGVLDPGALWLTLRRHVRLIAAIAVAATLLGLTVALVLPARYTATTVLLIDPRQQRVLQSEAVLSGIGNDSAAVESQIEVIQSTTLARRVIAELRLADDPEFMASGSGSVLGRLRALLPSSAARGDPMQQIIARFEDNLRVQRRGQTYVLEISAISRDPDRAATIANAVAKAYLDGQVSQKRDATAEASGWLDGRLDDLRRQADAADRAVADYKAAHNIVDTGDRSGQRQTLIEQQLADINGQLVQARVKQDDVQSRYDQVRRASPDSVGQSGLPEALQSPVILALRTQYAATARSVAEMTQVYGPRHPAIRTGQAELDELRRQLSAELGRIAAGLRNELESAKARVRSLETALRSLKSQSADTDQATVRLHELQREADATRTVLGQFLTRYKETSEQQSLQVPDARVLSPASPPLKASSPNVPLLVGLFAVVGLALGIAAALLRDRLSPALRSVRDLEDLLALPVLALLPGVSLPSTGPRQGRLARYALDFPLSPFGEAIRGLALRLRPSQASEGSVLLVAAALPGEGASTVAANLARAIARSGTSTMLVDTDLRRAAAPGSPPGLFEAMRDGTSPLSYLRRDPDSGLLTLPAGRADDPGRASEMLTGRAMARVLGALRGKCDVVVLDGPPILATLDSRALLELADAALLVVAWDGMQRDSLGAAVESTGLNADRFIGAVLNRVDPETCAGAGDPAVAAVGEAVAA